MAVVNADFYVRCYYYIPHRLQIPWITYTVLVDAHLIRVPWLPSFVPNPVCPFSEKITFTDRLQNTACSFVFVFILPLFFPDPAPEVLDNFRRYGDFDSLSELESRSALWFLFTDDVVDYLRPMMPNMIHVGGLTVKRSTGELLTDIRNFIDRAEKGVILVAFRSMVSSVSPRMVEKFSSAFGRLDGYRVVWKLNNSDGVKTTGQRDDRSVAAAK